MWVDFFEKEKHAEGWYKVMSYRLLVHATSAIDSFAPALATVREQKHDRAVVSFSHAIRRLIPVLCTPVTVIDHKKGKKKGNCETCHAHVRNNGNFAT